MTEAVRHYGISLLRNSAVALEKDNHRVWLGGLDDVLEGKPNLADTFRGTPDGEAKILLKPTNPTMRTTQC